MAKSKNHEYVVVTYLFLAMFIALIGYFIYYMVFLSENFINNPYNSLQNLFSEYVVRGDIESADGYTLATTTVDDDGAETRTYPYKDLFAHAVGYTTKGKSGIENQANFLLLRSHSLFTSQLLNDIKGEKSLGDTVVTTLNYKLQQTAYDALGSHDGAVIVMEPSTGKILAMVSKPSFDPNTIDVDWDDIISGENALLVNRATQGKYAPGSVFKILTTLEYYREQGADVSDFSFDCKSYFTYEGKTIHCASDKSHGTENLKEAFANSCNSSFASISLTLNLEQFQKTCDDLLFNQDLPVSFESGQSRFQITADDSSSLVMETGIGQGKTLVSPLHMLLLTSAIDNNGTLMTPYLIDSVKNTYGDAVKSYTPSVWGTLFTSKEASFLEEYMRSVVTDGTGKKLDTEDYTAYGKTGTAQVSDTTDQTNAWFIGYAKNDREADIALAVIVEDSGSGSKYAVPVAKKIFDAYFE
ncbi:MAG: penicillin-binding protein 2 [Agathobacter sp.]|nr:penicillin-binding protein 2 [Agathobacter sp.]